ARILELRRQGYVIVNETKTVDGQKHGTFQLVSEPEISSRKDNPHLCNVAQMPESANISFFLHRENQALSSSVSTDTDETTGTMSPESTESTMIGFETGRLR